MLTASDPNQDSTWADTPSSQRQVESYVELNASSDTIADMDVSDFKHLSMVEVHHESHHNPSPHENLSPDTVRNKIITHYNCIIIGSFKEFF